MAEQGKVTIGQLVEMKRRGEKISMITCYDYPNALLVDRAGMDIVLVGDSLGMTVLGYPNTLPVTMTEMIIFAKAVTRACKRAFVIGDMPYMSYQPSVEGSVANAGRFMAGVRHRALHAGLIAHVGHVPYDEGPLAGPGHRLGEDDHLRHGHRQG